jgi:hypothetical protein
MNCIKLSISKGNTKIGKLPSISFPPIVTCAKNVPCASKCYALKAYRQYHETKNAWDNNLTLWQKNPGNFINQFNDFLKKSKPKHFRYFVSGDIPDPLFFELMKILAVLHPETIFMAYTKRALDFNLSLPFDIPNLIIRKSIWAITESDYNLTRNIPFKKPVTFTIPKDKPEIKFSTLCLGSCTECGHICWNADTNVSIRLH